MPNEPNNPTVVALRHLINAMRQFRHVLAMVQDSDHGNQHLDDAGAELDAAEKLIAENDPALGRAITGKTVVLIIDLDDKHPQPPERCTVDEFIVANALDESDAEEFRLALIDKGYTDSGGGAMPAYRIEVEDCAFALSAVSERPTPTRSDLQPAQTKTPTVSDIGPISPAGGTLAQAVPPVPSADDVDGEGK